MHYRKLQKWIAVAASVSSVAIGALYEWVILVGGGWNLHAGLFIAAEAVLGAPAIFLTSARGSRIAFALGLLLAVSSLSIGASVFLFAIPGFLMMMQLPAGRPPANDSG